MDIWDVRREALIPVWQGRIQECRASGLTVRAWCAKNNISHQTYYNWEKLCLSRVDQNRVVEETPHADQNALIKITPEQLPLSQEKQESSQSIAPAELIIHCGCVSMDISSQMPVSKIVELVSALNSRV